MNRLDYVCKNCSIGFYNTTEVPERCHKCGHEVVAVTTVKERSVNSSSSKVENLSSHSEKIDVLEKRIEELENKIKQLTIEVQQCSGHY